jgi:glycosyltransferase involved in cell wall biosynthesis
MNNLHVLMVSTSYPADELDWRGRFIADMAAAISKKTSSLSVWAPPGKLPPGITNTVSASDTKWLAKLLVQGGIAHVLRTRPFKGVVMACSLLRRLRLQYDQERAGVLHINWLQNALPLGKTRTPTVVTVLGSDFRLLNLPGMVHFIRKSLSNRPAIIAPNATWMVPTLENHFGDIAEIRAIPFGVDVRWFGIRRLPVMTPAKWLAVTRITADKIGDLFAWGAGVFGDDRELHLFGPMQEKVALPDWVIWHGPTHPDELAEKWFPHATGLISLSRHSEGRPQVLLEAMAAGLPAVVSNLPAHQDVVINGQTGWIVDSPASLVRALDQAEIKEINRQVGEKAKSYLQDNIGDWDQCADRFIEAYRDLIAQSHAA